MSEKPVTIKAGEWNTIADAVKRGDVEARDIHEWIILEQVHETPLDPLFMEFKERDSTDGQEAIMTQRIDDVFTLVWHDETPRKDRDIMQEIETLNDQPSEPDTLLQAIEGILYKNEISGINELEAALASLREQITTLQGERDTLLKFYTFMRSVDATGDVMLDLETDMNAAQSYDISKGGSGNVPEIEAWAEYDALLTEIETLRKQS